ncbi:uncharacterized protein LOC124160791 [Ischnura elegans]|uniref:uncharacterized protein LOC124160791 n=1 Tax=Ischnura elegans TaxID=197161 RepID=UPI001ED87CF6|nr:uncharacterized protein LOC124160791 [Ischnura elegans]XP_046392787.1 uncharacterized protein LOC124160791 [Ischnura elegans]
METSEAVDDDESCRSSVISDLEELEANLYSYVHHERNSCFEEEYSPAISVSNVERVTHLSVSRFENEDDYLHSLSGRSPNSSGTKEDCLTSSLDEPITNFADSACIVSRYGSDVNSPLKPSDNVDLVPPSGKSPKSASGQFNRSQACSPPVLDVSSSDDLDPVEDNKWKRKPPASSTPFKEFVVIDDSEDEVQIEFERMPTKSKKKKKRRTEEIKEDIRLNTKSHSELVCLDVEDDTRNSEKENFESFLCDQGFDNSDGERSLCKSWTSQMVQFYDEPWGGECVNVKELQRTMSDDGWKVDLSDQFSSLTSKFENRRYFGMKSKLWCTRCNQKGHHRNACQQKVSPPHCHRCGSPNHQEYSCNQKICLTCGRNRSSLMAVCQQCRKLSRKNCYICKQPGHPPGCCPDLWRRFHATVSPGEIVAPAKVLYKDAKNTYCCNCASRGHHVFQCKKNNFSDYIPINPKVTSYIQPEFILKSQNTYNRTPSNWESIGAVAPENYNEDGGQQSYLERGVKRPQHSGKLPKTKIRRLNDTSFTESAGVEVSSNKKIKVSEKSSKRNKVKAAKLKVKKSLRPEKKMLNKDKFSRLGDGGDLSSSNSTPGNIRKHNDVHARLDPGAMAEANDIRIVSTNTGTGSVERIVVLSPGHLKQIESAEGKKILKHVTDQFQGVTAKVVNNPSGILRLMGTGNDINAVKSALFDALNEKHVVTNSLLSNGNESCKLSQNAKKLVDAVRSKNFKKTLKKQNQLNNQEKCSKNQSKSSIKLSDEGHVKKSDIRPKSKKEIVMRTKSSTLSNRNESINLGKSPHWQSVVYNDLSSGPGNNHNPVDNYLPEVQEVGSSLSRKHQEDNWELTLNAHQVTGDVSWARIARSDSNYSSPNHRINKGKLRKRKNKSKNQFIAFKQGEIINGKTLSTCSPASDFPKNGKSKSFNYPLKYRKKKRALNVGENSNDHSRLSENQQFSKYGLSIKRLRVQESSKKQFSPQVS